MRWYVPGVFRVSIAVMALGACEGASAKPAKANAIVNAPKAADTTTNPKPDYHTLTRVRPHVPPSEICNYGMQDARRCYGQVARDAEAIYARYRAAALKDLRRDAADPDYRPYAEKSIREFNKAQKLFISFRESQCQARANVYGGGTISTDMFSYCFAFMTRQHAHLIWDQFLSFGDGRRPLLPEPLVFPGYLK